MKIALSHAMRQLIKKDIEEWHNQVLVLGITTDRQASHLYSLHCSSISLNGKSITLSNFTLSFIGSYKHEVVMDRIHLIARIMTALIYPNNEEVTEYLTTQRQISMMSSNQKNEISFPKLDADNQLIEYDKNFDPIQTRSTLKKGKINGVEYFIKYQPNININEDSIRYNFLTLYAPMIDGNFSLSLAGKCMTRFFNKGKKINIMAFFIDLLVQVCFLQKQQITHNDIKPENIVLYDKHWFMIDFEIATKFSLEDGICVDKNLNPLTSKNFSEENNATPKVVHLKQKAEIVKTYFQDKDYFLRKHSPKREDSVSRTLAF
ncbi:predicted protein [Naegleria gruberi]|uniref:Predicted protein n=1 Tax=Naegleria gruberi TaxID=5762 RepID=D2W451_NAEGR|nr:uncharacterized protein NAEGRDRAFT_76181 [Naegleria gruberi]EFC36150.1 predicted protein [Naegleria gruberi]|eukprot:XP_002668894.1 predicted protein [Naegleria gruberi strain NEG-M]